jgi:hypothetical protein
MPRVHGLAAKTKKGEDYAECHDVAMTPENFFFFAQFTLSGVI